jgi:hypothetical protein
MYADRAFNIEVLPAIPPWIEPVLPNVGRWGPISLNTLSDIDPEDDPALNPNYPGSAPWHQVQGQAGQTDAWNGGIYASRRGPYGALCLYGGGHNAYAGSEIPAFDLRTRMWELASKPYPGPFNWPYPTGVYPDGSPVPPHTYDTLAYHPPTNRFVKMRSVMETTSQSSNSLIVPYIQTYDFDTGVWTNSPPHNSPFFSAGYSCYDSLRGLIWGCGGSSSDGFIAFDPVLNQVVVEVPFKLRMTDSPADYDPINDIIVVPGFRDGSDVHAWSLAGNVANNAKKILNQAGTIPNRESSSAWAWSPHHQGFIYYRRDGAVYLFKHTSGAWDTGTWTWTLLTDPGNTVIPPIEESSGGNSNGVYSRGQVASFTDGVTRREIFMVVNDVQQPVYGFRVA